MGEGGFDPRGGISGFFRLGGGGAGYGGGWGGSYRAERREWGGLSFWGCWVVVDKVVGCGWTFRRIGLRRGSAVWEVDKDAPVFRGSVPAFCVVVGVDIVARSFELGGQPDDDPRGHEAIVAGFVGDGEVGVFRVVFVEGWRLGQCVEKRWWGSIDVPIVGMVILWRSASNSSKPDRALMLELLWVDMYFVSTMRGKRPWISSWNSDMVLGRTPKKHL